MKKKNIGTNCQGCVDGSSMKQVRARCLLLCPGKCVSSVCLVMKNPKHMQPTAPTAPHNRPRGHFSRHFNAMATIFETETAPATARRSLAHSHRTPSLPLPCRLSPLASLCTLPSPFPLSTRPSLHTLNPTPSRPQPLEHKH
jgi:hypothetical protein